MVGAHKMTLSQPIGLAAIAYDRGFDIDRLLVTACERLSRRGIRLGGLLQVSTGAKGGCASTVHVVDLRTNTAFDIWEDRGAGSKGCRLDERGLAAASRAIDEAIDDRVDRHHESISAGPRASAADYWPPSPRPSQRACRLPTAVRTPYDLAWAKFHGGLGHELPPDVQAVVAWVESTVVGCELAVGAASQVGAACRSMTRVVALGSLGAPERSAIHALATPRRAPTAAKPAPIVEAGPNIELRELQNRAARAHRGR